MVDVIDSKTLLDWQSSAAELVCDAGALLSKFFPSPVRPNRNLEIDFKDGSSSDPVTQADTETQDFIVKEIQRRYPDHGIVGEEDHGSDVKAPDTVWIIDPLDGTRNFMYGFPFYACSIGVMHRGVPVVGAVFLPWPGREHGIVLECSWGSGASVDGIPISVIKKGESDPKGLRTLPGSFETQFGSSTKGIGEAGEVRMAGSIVYEMSMVALGVTQYAAIPSARLWDITAGVALIIEAGGIVMHLDKGSSITPFFSGKREWDQTHSLLPLWGSRDYTFNDLRKPSRPMLIGYSGLLDRVFGDFTGKRRHVKTFTRYFYRG
jgi:myo-inositol-1(or 4)-monophosphatase